MAPRRCRTTTTSPGDLRSVWRTSRTRPAKEGITIASSRRSTCSLAGQNSTTLPSFIPSGDEIGVENHREESHKRPEWEGGGDCNRPPSQWMNDFQESPGWKRFWEGTKKGETIIGTSDWSDDLAEEQNPGFEVSEKKLCRVKVAPWDGFFCKPGGMIFLRVDNIFIAYL